MLGEFIELIYSFLFGSPESAAMTIAVLLLGTFIMQIFD